MKRTSIKNIAEKLGISNATVSLVLSGKHKDGRVGAELAEKIVRTAKEMNYQPNALARSLRVGSSQIIGLIVADISNLFFSSLAFHIQEEAEKYGYSVIITNTNESVKKMDDVIHIFRNRQVDGFIIVPTEGSEKYVQDLVNDRIPLVLIDRYFPFVPTNYVVIDNYRAALDATRILIERKCKRIAMITYKNVLPHILERKSGYIDALTYSGMADAICVKEIRYSHMEDDISKAIRELLCQEDKIDGIFFSTNTISLSGIKSLMNEGVDISKDIQVVCFDKNEAFELMSISIPYVLQPIADIGKKAVEVLINEIKTKKSENKEIVNLKLPATIHNI